MAINIPSIYTLRHLPGRGGRNCYGYALSVKMIFPNMNINIINETSFNIITTMCIICHVVFFFRVASMQDGAYKEKKPSIIEESIRNLRSSEHENKLWLIDNESGLIDAYDLMYRSQQSGQRWVCYLFVRP